MSDKNMPVEDLHKKRKSPAGKKKTGLVLIAALVAILIAFGAYYLLNQQKLASENVAPEDHSVALIERSPDEIERVDFSVHGSEDYSVVRAEDGAFTLADKPWFQVENPLAQGMLNALTPLTAVEQIAENAEDLSQYGLAEPGVRARIHFSDGTQTTLTIGDMAPTGTMCYAVVDDQNTVYGLPSYVQNRLYKPMEFLHVRPALSIDKILQLTIERKDSPVLEVGYIDAAKGLMSSNNVCLRQPFYYEADPENVNALFESIREIVPTAYVSHIEDESQLADYGLDDPALALTITDLNQSELVIRAGNLTDDGSCYYVQLDDTGDVYTCDAMMLAEPMNTNVPLLADLFACLVDVAKVDEMTVTSGGASHTLSIQHQEENNISFFYDQTETDTTVGKELYQAVIGLVHDKPMSDEALSDEPLMSVEFRFNTGMENFRVDFYPVDNDYCAIFKNNEAHFLIKRSKVENAWALFSQTEQEASEEESAVQPETASVSEPDTQR